MADPDVKNCSIVNISSFTIIPQTFTVQLTTSVVPPTLIRPDISCPNHDGINCSTPYYRHIYNETYQYLMPVSWNPANGDQSNITLSCTVKYNTTEIKNFTSIKGISKAYVVL